MKEKIKKIIIAKDGFPLEQITGKPITNFFRRLLLGSHKECKDCWNSKQAKKSFVDNVICFNPDNKKK